MGIHFNIPLAAKMEIHRGMLREERQHVVKERHTRFDRGLPGTVNLELDRDLGLFRFAPDLGVTDFHGKFLNAISG